MYRTTFGAGPSIRDRARSVSPLRPSTSRNPSTKDRARSVSPLRPPTSLGSPEGTRAKQLKTLTLSIDACLLETEDITQSPRYQEASRIALNLIELCSDPVTFFAGKTQQRVHETKWIKSTKDFTSKIEQLFAIAERYDTPEKTDVAKEHITKLVFRVNANIIWSEMSPLYKFGFDNKTRKFVPERIPQSHLLKDASAHTSSPLSTLLMNVRSENEETVKRTISVFLEARGDLNDSNIFGDTPLHVAAQYGNLDAVQVLLDTKANPNIENEKGFTPLDKAIHAGHKDVCRLLLSLSDEPSITLNVRPDDWARVHKIG